MQWLDSFSKGLDVIFVPLCISFDILYMYESFLLIIGDFILFVKLDSIWSRFMKLDFKFDWKLLLEFELNEFTLYITLQGTEYNVLIANSTRLWL